MGCAKISRKLELMMFGGAVFNGEQQARGNPAMCAKALKNQP